MAAVSRVKIPIGASLEMMVVPEAANMPPTPWQTEILASGIWAGTMPRIWRMLSCNAYMPYMPECMYEKIGRAHV